MHKITASRITASVLGVLLASSLASFALPAGAQEVFPSPEAASTALVDAAKAPKEGTLDKIFGPGGKDLIASGDPDVDSERLADFLELASKGNSVIDGQNGEKILVYGTDQWPFPIPLRPSGTGWAFDIKLGKQQITDLTIGQNELVAIGACEDYVAAQNEYFRTLHDDEPVQQFARKLVSTEGRHDGLYWEPATPTDHSPLGDRIVAAAVRTSDDPTAPRSYHGYRYHILTRQGPDAPGGAYDYLVNGRLLAGFALLAYPEKWGETGIMTFLCDQRGNVYERNLGPSTDTVAPVVRRFNPGPDWDPVQP
ncbi:hypothetical protein K32_40790 [Kaistia sp. 32K]|uniref:DUF2950 domain-containing protein n=1 Tax=Kaistia sp. 32K TaxID=2795690 RepID=UPI0019362313|nr:DUF2950 domain-containing protein [Kaistia sp. 32K]BCP55462.1 hypothetical protein K32_40790 [Kaistia sp. 32K]